MSYIKNSLPDDWESPDPSTKKYICIGTKEIQAKWYLDGTKCLTKSAYLLESLENSLLDMLNKTI